MSFFGSIGHAITGIGHAAGKVLSNPLVQTVGAGLLGATGVGAPLAAGILAGGGALGGALKPGGNLGQAAMGGATGALSGYGGAKLGSSIASGGLKSGVLSALGVGGVRPSGGYNPGASVPGYPGGQDVQGGGGGLLGGLQQALGAGGWGQTLLQTAGGVAGGALDARQQQAALDERQREFNATQGLDQSRFNMQQQAQNYQMANDRARGADRQAILQALMQRLGAQRVG